MADTRESGRLAAVSTAPSRFFLVGFPRSGTTLLQSLLAGHPQIAIPPETWFFMRLASWKKTYRCLKPTRRNLRERLELLAAIDPRLAPHPAIGAMPAAFAGGATARYVDALDSLAARAGATIWVEKTPIHLHRIPLIRRRVEGVRFIHLVREGLPAIASLYSVAREYPADWGRRSLDECIERWRLDARLSCQYHSEPGHCFVSYERLVDNPSRTLARLCAELGVADDHTAIEAMTDAYRSQSARLSLNEPWKSGVAAPIVDRNRSRLDSLWSPAEQREIGARIAAESAAVGALPYLA